MNQRDHKILEKLQNVLWSYNIKDLDLNEDRQYIIAQVLNYGDWADLKLLYKLYSEEDIKKVVKNPKRGVWFKKALNFWTIMLGVQTEKDIWEKAIFK